MVNILDGNLVSDIQREENDPVYNAQIDAIESMALAMHYAGCSITTINEVVETTLDAIGNAI